MSRAKNEYSCWYIIMNVDLRRVNRLMSARKPLSVFYEVRIQVLNKPHIKFKFQSTGTHTGPTVLSAVYSVTTYQHNVCSGTACHISQPYLPSAWLLWSYDITAQQRQHVQQQRKKRTPYMEIIPSVCDVVLAIKTLQHFHEIRYRRSLQKKIVQPT
jgi:hypothetical protein